MKKKMEIDYSCETTAAIDNAKALIEAGKLDEAVEKLYALEKQTRLAADSISTGKILAFLTTAFAESGKWDELNEFLSAFTKKRQQLKLAVTSMVQKACEYVDKTPNLDAKLKLIAVLRNITEGKIYVEIERARLTKILADIKESSGNIAEAADILQELQVETFGSMEKREKTEFILEQMRLCLAKKDFVRTQIISRKISAKYFKEENTEDLKVRFYNLMIMLNLNNGAYTEVSRNYIELFNTNLVKTNDVERLSTLSKAVVYLLLSPFDNEKNDLMHRFKRERDMENLSQIHEMLSLFTTMELIQWSTFCATYESMVYEILRSSDPEATQEVLLKRYEDLHRRCMEHNIRVMAACYSRISQHRMAELLNMDHKQCEEVLSELVVNKTIHARVDRLKGEVHFLEKKAAVQILNDWSRDLDELMHLLSKTNHLIKKERMVCAKFE